MPTDARGPGQDRHAEAGSDAGKAARARGDIPLAVLASSARGSSVGHADWPRDSREKCAVFGVWTRTEQVGGSNGHAPTAGMLTYLGLYAQQHRGQEAAGIAGSDGRVLRVHTGTGLVPDVLTESVVRDYDKFATHGAIGHTRYSTAGGSLACNAQPFLESYVGGQVAIAHNGNLVNADALRKDFERRGHLFHTTSDTECVIHLLASPEQQSSVDPVAATLRHLQGAFSLLLLFKDRIEAARDPWGWRPLVLGRIPGEHDAPGDAPGGAWVVASETVALDVVGATFVREVEPGEIVTLSHTIPGGIASRRFAPAAMPAAHCVFEHVYFAHPASKVFGQNVQVTRERLGERLAAESPVQADFVVPMPDSGRSAAVGYARASGIQLREAIVPNRYVGRTFIRPTQAQRQAAVRLKLNVVGDIVRGKRLIIVDDSIVRGTTTKAKIEQIRQAGASEIHLRISCPPIRHPCFFGVDFATRDQLIAAGKTVEQVRAFLGVDSLAYLSLEGLLSCMDRAPGQYCTACFSGDYRIDVEHPTTDEVMTPQQRIFEAR